VATDQKPSWSGVCTVGSCHQTGAWSRWSRKMSCGNPPGEDVEIGQVHRAEVVHYGAILMTEPGSVKNGCSGGVAQQAEAGRLNRPQ
jgi:hypothetical protein